MSGSQLEALRKARGLTRDELALQLLCSAQAIVKWERNERPVPKLVAEKMLRTVPVELPLEAIYELLDHCMQTGQPFNETLGTALRSWLADRSTATPTPPQAHY